MLGTSGAKSGEYYILLCSKFLWQKCKKIKYWSLDTFSSLLFAKKKKRKLDSINRLKTVPSMTASPLCYFVWAPFPCYLIPRFPQPSHRFNKRAKNRSSAKVYINLREHRKPIAPRVVDRVWFRRNACCLTAVTVLQWHTIAQAMPAASGNIWQMSMHLGGGTWRSAKRTLEACLFSTQCCGMETLGIVFFFVCCIFLALSNFACKQELCSRRCTEKRGNITCSRSCLTMGRYSSRGLDG